MAFENLRIETDSPLDKQGLVYDAAAGVWKNSGPRFELAGAVDGQAIVYDAATGTWAPGAGGGGTPGGLDTQVQFNDGGVFGGDAALTYNKTTNALTPLNIQADVTSGLNIKSTQRPIDASGFTAALAGAGAGNVSNGTHLYKFEYGSTNNPADVGYLGTGGGGAPTSAVTVTNNAVNGQVNVSVPFVLDAYFPYVNIYRDKNGDGIYKFALSANYTGAVTLTDNVADGSLGPTMSAASTATATSIYFDDGIFNVPYNGAAGLDLLVFGPATETQIWTMVSNPEPGGSGHGWFFEGQAGNVAGGALRLSGGLNTADPGGPLSRVTIPGNGSADPMQFDAPTGFTVLSPTASFNGALGVSGDINAALVKATLQTSANAVTGLVAGAFASLTNATLVLTDGAGVVYRIPAMTP